MSQLSLIIFLDTYGCYIYIMNVLLAFKGFRQFRLLLIYVHFKRSITLILPFIYLCMYMYLIEFRERSIAADKLEKA